MQMQDTRRGARRLRSAMLAVVMAAGVAVAASTQQAPVYKAEVDVVPVDLVVTDREGRPVSGLQAEDFRVTVDGQPRKVLTAQFLSSAAAPSPGRAELPRKGAWDIDAAFESVYIGNEKGVEIEKMPSRNVMIVVDQASFTPAAGRRAAVAARGLLDMLHPNDRVGLAVIPPVGPFVRPSRDHQRVRQALAQVSGIMQAMPRGEVSMSLTDALGWTGGDSTARENVTQRFCSTMGGAEGAAACIAELNRAAAEVIANAREQSLTTLRGLGDIIRAASLDGSASAVVILSAGLYASGRASRLGVDGDMRIVGRVAAASRAMVFALYVESGFLDRDSMDKKRLAGFSTEDGDLGLDGLRDLAGMSGGSVTRMSNTSDEAFRRVSLELSAYYLLGIEGVPGDRDGRRHRLRVTVARPDVSVRSREELFLPVVKKLTPDETIKEALGGAELQRELRIRLSTQMMREPGSDKVRLLISALIGEGVARPSPVRVAYSIRGAGAETATATSDIQNDTLPLVGTGAGGALSYFDAAQLTPGRYLLRLAAVDEGGKVGSVQQVVDATLIAADVGTFSDLMLADPARPVKDRFTPVADGRMTGDSVEAFLEVYPAPGHEVKAVGFDVSDTPGGPAIVSGSVVPEKRGDRLVAGGRLELRALPPGVYILNALVMEGDKALGRTSRPFMLDRRVGAADAAAEPRAAMAFAATGRLVAGFSREDALRPDALGYFLNRLQAAETASPGEPVAEATAALRSANYEAVLAALPAESDQLSAVFLRGLALFAQGQLEPAAKQFRATLRIADDFLPAAFYLGACYAAGGLDREAVGAWQTSLVSESGSRMIYEVLADALLRLNDGKQAEAILEEARERWPGDDVFLPRLAAAKVILSRRSEALALLEPYIERHQLDSEPLFLAIRLLYEAHDSRKPLKGAVEDRTLAAKYGELYRATNGANQPLVARWVAAMK